MLSCKCIIIRLINTALPFFAVLPRLLFGADHAPADRARGGGEPQAPLAHGGEGQEDRAPRVEGAAAPPEGAGARPARGVAGEAPPSERI